MDRNVPAGIMIAIIIVFIAVSGCVTVYVNTPTPQVIPQQILNESNTSSHITSYSGGSSVSTLDPVSADTNQTPEKTPYPTARVTLNPQDKSDVNQRFQEVVFGNEAQYLNRWENRHVKLGIAGDYLPEDVQTLTDFVIRFNNESDTTKLTRPYERENEEFTVHLVPSSYFSTIDENIADKVVRNTETGEVLFVDMTDKYSWVEKDTIYINSRFTGPARKYLILRGLLYDLGFEGYTDDPTSIFHYEAKNTNLSKMDWAVIDLLYSKKFDYGESISSVRSKLN